MRMGELQKIYYASSVIKSIKKFTLKLALTVDFFFGLRLQYQSNALHLSVRTNVLTRISPSISALLQIFIKWVAYCLGFLFHRTTKTSRVDNIHASSVVRSFSYMDLHRWENSSYLPFIVRRTNSSILLTGSDLSPDNCRLIDSLCFLSDEWTSFWEFRGMWRHVVLLLPSTLLCSLT